MYIIYVNHDSVIKQICQLRDKAFLINETAFKTNSTLRACLHGSGGPQVGEVACLGGVTRLFI